MHYPLIDYNYWLNKWNKSVGNSSVYSNKNIINWSNFEGSLLDCETQILKITTKEYPDDDEIFKTIDLINQWGGKTSRMFYVSIKNQEKSPRELIMESPNLELYKKGIKLSKLKDYTAVEYFRKVKGIGPSFMGKHATFWSSFNLVIIDNKIAGMLGFMNPLSLLRNYSYEAFMNHINNIQIKNSLISPVHVERAFFSFHSNYFDNENRKFKSKIDDFTDLNIAIEISKKLKIDVPKDLKK